jgi:tape measure domain-containing protein
MSTIDDKVVEMTFRGAGFLSGAQAALGALTGLKNGLNSLKGAEDSINQLDDAAKRFSLSGLSSAADAVGSHFSAMRVVAFTAIANITNRALNAGISIAKSLTIDPIKQGLDVYETKINAIQTILANTQAQGTNLKQVTDALNILNQYANQTVFSFADMTKNIGTFTAAGVDLQTSVNSIKGIANLAALSGASADQASQAMYQLSQAIAAGSVKLQDWNSVVNAGLGGKTFQTALINTARATGTNIDAIIKKAGSFRNSLQQGWLTSKILTQTLSQFTGDLSAKQLKAMGFTDQEAQQILKLGKTAVASAVNIRTITQLMAALHEEVATAWSRVWETLIGNIGDATSLLTKVHNVLENMFTTPLNKLNTFLQAWVKLGGRDLLIQTLTEAFHNLGAVLHVIGQAFHDVFPPVTVQSFIKLSIVLQNFVSRLTLSSKGAEELRATFRGLFSIIKIVVDVIEGIVGALGHAGAAAAGAGGSILSITAKIGDFLSNVRKSIESGNALATFFRFMGNVLAFPAKAIQFLVDGLGHFGTASQKAADAAQPLMQKIANAFKGLGAAIGKAIQSGGLSNVIHILNQLLLGGVLLSIRNFFKNLGKGSGGGGGLVAGIKESFESLTGALKAMQTNLKSGTLQKIAIAVALLAASLVALSFVNVGNLTKALTAMTVMFTELLSAMAVVSKIAGAGGIIRMPIIAASLNLLATSIVILSGAVAILSRFSWTELAKGIGAIAAILTVLTISLAFMSANAKGVLFSAAAMETMAVAMNVMSFAVARLGKLDFGTLVKGVGAIAALLAILAGFNAISGVQLISTAVAMTVVGAALLVLTQVIKELGSLSIGTLAKGLIAVAAGLVIIAAAMAIMPPSMLVTAASLLVVSAALVVLSKALTTLGGMSWAEIAKSLVELAGALVIIAAAMILMVGALPGAAALLVISGSLAILTPVLIALGGLSWGSILKGLAALAGVFVLLGAAGLLLGPLIPVLLGLGAAIALLGVGLLAAGGGIALFAVGLTTLAVGITATGGAIVSFVNSILSTVPLAGRKLGEGIAAFATGIAKGAVAIENAFVAILTAILNGIIRVVPLAGQAFTAILNTIINVIRANAGRVAQTMASLILLALGTISRYMPSFVARGVQIIVSFLNGIAANVGRVITAGANIAIAFINGITSNGLRITQAGINAIIRFVNGLASQIRASSGAMRAAGFNLAAAIIDGMTGGLASLAGRVLSEAKNLAGQLLSTVGSFLGIGSPSKEFHKLGVWSMIGFSNGLETSAKFPISSVKKASADVLTALQKSLSEIQVPDTTLNPVITPVLDLSTAKKGFDDLATLVSAQTAAASSSTSVATSISAASQAAAGQAAATPAAGTSLTFVQNNTSPVALDAVTIYRQTKNQLSVVKGALPS